ncbi:MAG: PH domain-containing protein [Actinomycetota bacterium]
MGGYTEKLQAKAGDVMAPDERVLAAIRTMPRGTTVGMGIGGVLGAAVAQRQAKKGAAEQAEGSVAATWPTVRSAVGLTNRRLLIYDYTMMGKPKDLIGEFPVDTIASVDVDKGITNKVRFGFNDGSAAQVECAKLDKVDDFVSAFQNVKSGTSG